MIVFFETSESEIVLATIIFVAIIIGFVYVRMKEKKKEKFEKRKW